MRCYRPEELFDEHGRAARRSSPRWRRRASGGWAPTRTPTAACCCATSSCPTSATTPSRSPRPATDVERGDARARRVPARRDRAPTRTTSASSAPTRPPRTASAPCSRRPTARGRRSCSPTDDHLAPDGRVMEVLSEHLCQGWLEGYLLTGRHGLFNCYEAFIHIVDSMFNQHAKWLKVTRGIPWRRPIASLNYLLSSHVWRQDHNGFSHQDPGFIDHVDQQEGRGHPRLPAAGRQHACCRSPTTACAAANYVNVIVAGKQPALNYLTMDEAIAHCTRGHRDLGVGEQRRRRASPTSCSPAPATSRRSRRSPRRRSCASTCPTCGCASSTSST